MKKQNYDVFRSYLFKNIDYIGELEIPILHSSYLLPNRLISFSKALKTKDYNQWVHFYENDETILRVWRNPKKYLPILKKFYGVISPDFSIHRNMSLFMQIQSIFNGRVLGNYWQQNGIEVIANVRFNDSRTYKFAFEGIDKNANISIGSLGCLKKNEERKFFVAGLEEMMKTLTPKNLIVYGSAPEEIFDRYKNNTNIIQFPSQISKIYANKVI
ncbi:MAG: DUF4417 domain-containing protein [Selenomonadaceae bacterium]|nr:DUF4417 domain-containing protein [Selenomonadaceae bacterium]MBR1730716.1 DUF4417 domain-containing protein [Selenomonadaceae bacterium]